MTTPTPTLFHQANQFIMPQTSLYDFFDYLAGQKLDIDEQKPLSQTLKITFKHIDSIPKHLYANRKFAEKEEKFRPIFLREVRDSLKEDYYPYEGGEMTQEGNRQKQYQQQQQSDQAQTHAPLLNLRDGNQPHTTNTSRKQHNKGIMLPYTQRKKLPLNSLNTNNSNNLSVTVMGPSGSRGNNNNSENPNM